MAKVYVSSTFVDLEECRRQVSILLRRMGHEDVVMEYYTAGNKRPVDKCLEDVAACDLYIGIFAWRYGWIPPDNNPDRRSVTEMEYRHAVRNGKECLIFLLHEDAPWPRKFVDRDPLGIEGLRTHLSDKHQCAFFKSDKDIGSVFSPAMYEWAKKQGHITNESSIFYLDAYYAALRKRYNRMDLEGLTPPQKEEYLQLQLRSIFVEQSVRENLPPVELPKESWDRLRQEREIHQEDLPREMALDDIRQARTVYYEKPLRAVLDVLADSRHQRAIILGDPGSGKSTLARYMLLSLIDSAGDEKIRRMFDGYLPVLVELRSYAGLFASNKCNTFLEFLGYVGQSEGWRIKADDFHNHLKNDGRAVVIFDGLDEIFNPEDRERISRQIVGFASDYPKARIITTSRIIGYRRGILSDADFSHFTLQDLNESQVATFVDRWYELALSDRPDEAKARRERILLSFKESASVRQLAGNPMLLTIMAIIGKHQELPRERWKLYDHAAGVLIEHWDVNRHLKARRVKADFIGEEEKKEMLRRLAYRMQKGAGGLAGNYIHREELQAEFEDYLKDRFGQTPAQATTIARALIDELRERNFILSLYGANLYGFVHRAFLEFFCASAFVKKFEKSQEMTLEQLKREAYAAHWQDRSWHEVLRLICGMIDEKFAGELIDCLTNAANQPRPDEYNSRPPWNIALAVQCLGELRNPGTVAEPARRLLNVVCSLFDYAGYYDLNFAKFLEEQIATSAETIGQQWPHRIILIDWLNNLDPSENAQLYDKAFGKLIASIGNGLNAVHAEILNYATHSIQWLRLLGSYALATGWRDNSLTKEMLYDRAVSDESEWVRRAALRALAEHYRDEAKTKETIYDRAVNDKDEDVRRDALRELAEHYRDEAKTKEMLYDRTVSDNNEWVRRAALRALAEHYRKEAETKEMLYDRAVSDKSEWVRRAALRALAEHYRKEAETKEMLYDRAVSDGNYAVRSDALRELAEHYQEERKTKEMLYDRAVSDKSERVRRAALRELAEHYRDEAKTKEMLYDRAVSDGNYAVRSDALTSLAEHYREERKTKEMLYDRAVSDNNEWVRRAALRALAEHYRDEEKTKETIYDRAVSDESEWVRRDALRELAEHYRDEEKTKEMLYDRTISDGNYAVRSDALTSLAEHYREEGRTKEMLYDRAVNDNNDWVRRAALRELAEHHREEGKTKETIYDRAVSDGNYAVRSDALRALAEHYRDEGKTKEMLYDRAVSDGNYAVRSDALTSLVRYFRSDLRTFPLLIRFLRSEHGAGKMTYITVIRKLLRWWQDDPEILPLLDLLSDENHSESLREAAKEAAISVRNHQAMQKQLLFWKQQK